MIAPYFGKFKVTQIYKGVEHKGIDLVGLDSKLILSTVDGVVQVAGWDAPKGMGLYIRIIGNDGLYYYYGHLSKVNVRVGQRVLIGTVLGEEGGTGKVTGNHLHYEVRTKIDNMAYIDISKHSGIPNKLGIYGGDELTEERVREIIKEILQGQGSTVSKWAEEHWDDMTEKGVTDGHRPQGYATREEVATMISRAGGIYGKSD